jgi:alpha-D-ribose 1-methylphosphonate 5-phosphate C-P lyase
MTVAGHPRLAALAGTASAERRDGYSFAFLDEHTKRELRRRTLKAVAIPGHQVAFGSREMPLARGWGTGGIQLTLSLIGPDDVLKVIDQGDDASMNAVNIRALISRTTGVRTTVDTAAATVIQTRHRVPEDPMRPGAVLVLQVPFPDPLRLVEPSDAVTRRMHAERDYAKMWLYLYEDVVRYGEISLSYRYPCLVNDGVLMDPTPIPRHDVATLHQSPTLHLFGAGREQRIYALPPYTDVVPIDFEDVRFQTERAGGPCVRCGATGSFRTEVPGTGWLCSDTAYCDAGAGSAGGDAGAGR